MRTKSGYFFVSSNAGGSTIMLWILRPRELVNQKCRGGCQSMLRAFSTLKSVRLRCELVVGSTRTTSAGSTELPHCATITGLFVAAARLVYTPRDGSTAIFTSPPARGTE